VNVELSGDALVQLRTDVRSIVPGCVYLFHLAVFNILRLEGSTRLFRLGHDDEEIAERAIITPNEMWK